MEMHTIMKCFEDERYYVQINKQMACHIALKRLIIIIIDINPRESPKLVALNHTPVVEKVGLCLIHILISESREGSYFHILNVYSGHCT